MTDLDQQLFLFLNSLHSSWLDPVMWWFSNRLIWIPLYAFVLYLIIRKYQWRSVGIILSIALLIAASDQFSVLIKNMVERPRPTHEPALAGQIHTLNNYLGGAYGFVSSHASNSFALATITTIFLSPFFRRFGYWAFTWAFLVSYSRIYLGVHYPGDILAGAAVGVLLAFIIHKLYGVFIEKCPNQYC